MKVFALTTAAGLALAAAAIYHADPGGRFGRAPYRFDKNWEDSQLLFYPFEPDERALRTAQLRVIDPPDLVLMGSSRMMPVGAEMFRPGLKIFNAGLSGATARDYAAIWQGLREAGKIPPRLIIYADPWIFNKNSGQFRWRANRALPAGVLWRNLLELDTSFNELLNGPVLLEAVKSLWRGRAREASARFIAESQHLPGTPGWRPDGSVHFGWSGHSLSEIRRLARNFAGETEVFGLGRYEFSPAEAAVLEALIKDASRSGTQVLLIVPPYHQDVLRRLSERPEYRGLISQFVDRLKRLSGGISLCEAQDPTAPGCSELEFQDGMHPLESCHRKILEHCLARKPWAGLVSLEAPRLAAAPRPAPRLPRPPAPPAPSAPSPIEWILIPGGRYNMGAPDLGAEPVHPVMIKTFELAKTPVTVSQYGACLRAGRCTKPGEGPDCNWAKTGRENFPVNCVDWNQARAFSNWAGGRLPSESEWEYAARSRGKYQMYPWGEEPVTCERAVMKGCAPDPTAPVCSKPLGRSEQGLCDMAGNVRQWTQDGYHSSYEGAPDDGSSWPSSDIFRVARGGSSSCTTENARVDVRTGYSQDYRGPSVGFRPARP